MRFLRFLARPLVLWRLPVVLGMALIALPALLVYGNALHVLAAGIPMYSDTKLNGAQLPAPMPDLTASAVASGSFGRAYARYFGAHFPLLAEAVRTKGQFYWSVLHQSPTWFITLGQHDVLYENDYLDEYCTRDIAAFTPAAIEWADKLAQVQHWYAAQGKVFLYLLTPSKAATEPEDMPLDWPCRASAADRTGLHAAYRSILAKKGVNLVDAVQTTLQAKADYPFPPFPPGGIHFNTVAAARAVQELIAVLARAGSWRMMNDFKFTWHMAAPNDVDTDLRDALNVPYPDMPYQTPSIDIVQERNTHCLPIMMAQVGGSFTYQIDKVLQRLSCPPNIDLYEYFRNTMAFYPGDLRYPVDPKRRAWALLDAAQIVVLEENEELAPKSAHGAAFFDLVDQRMQAKK